MRTVGLMFVTSVLDVGGKNLEVSAGGVEA